MFTGGALEKKGLSTVGTVVMMNRRAGEASTMNDVIYELELSPLRTAAKRQLFGCDCVARIAHIVTDAVRNLSSDGKEGEGHNVGVFTIDAR